jgi:hypothetical protein
MRDVAIFDGTGGDLPPSLRAAGLPIFDATAPAAAVRWADNRTGAVLISIGAPAAASMAAAVAVTTGAALVHCGAATDLWAIECGAIAPQQSVEIARSGQTRQLRLLRVDSTASDVTHYGLLAAIGGAAGIAGDLFSAESVAGIAGAVGRRILFGSRQPAPPPLAEIRVDGRAIPAADAMLVTTARRALQKWGKGVAGELAWAAHPAGRGGVAGQLGWLREGMHAGTTLEFDEAPLLVLDGRTFAADAGARLRIGVGPLVTVRGR